MKHIVLKPFVDKESGVYFTPGSFYVCDKLGRVHELDKMGFIKANENTSSLEKKTTSAKVNTRKKASE